MKKANIFLLCIVITTISNIFPISAQTEADSRQYLFPEFSSGIVRKKNGSTSNLTLNYNTITQKMAFSDGKKIFDIANEALIDTIILNARKFIPYNGAFCEVLVKAPFSLLLQHKSDLVPKGSPAGYGTTSQTSAIDSYTGTNASINLKNLDQYEIKPAPVYWIVSNSSRASFVTRNEFMKVFTQDREELQNFIRKNRTRFEDPLDVAKLVIYYNKMKRH
jgi:hypothetical protein